MSYVYVAWEFAADSHVLRARGNVDGWGTMLQAGSPDEVDFWIDLILHSRTMALGSTQPLTEMSTRNLPGG
jgi:hypothetical protein